MILENIRSLCRERGISIARLEKTLGLGNATIRGWGSSSPSVDKLKQVADYFGTTVDALIRSPTGQQQDTTEYVQ